MPADNQKAWRVYWRVLRTEMGEYPTLLDAQNRKATLNRVGMSQGKPFDCYIRAVRVGAPHRAHR